MIHPPAEYNSDGHSKVDVLSQWCNVNGVSLSRWELSASLEGVDKSKGMRRKASTFPAHYYVKPDCLGM